MNNEIFLNKDGKEIEYVFNDIDVRDFATIEHSATNFSNIEGLEDEKQLIKKEFLLDSSIIEFRKQMRIKFKNSILLYGLNDNANSNFAKAIAGEFARHNNVEEKMPIIIADAKKLDSPRVGATEQNIIALFNLCSQFERCVLCFDGFENIARDRKKVVGDPTVFSIVTTILQSIDGFNKNSLFIGIANKKDDIDEAALKRLAEHIEIK